MDIKRKMALIAEALDMEMEELNENTLLADLDSWDSLSKLTLVTIMDDNFHKTMTADDMQSFQTVKDILDRME